MKTIIRSILTLSLAAAIFGLTSCQGYDAPSSNQSNVRPYNPSGITPR